MAMNQVQMQPGLSLREFMHRFSTDAACEAALVAGLMAGRLRLPRIPVPTAHHVRAPEPHALAVPALAASIHGDFEYDLCVTKLSSTVSFLAMYLLTQAKNNVSTLKLRRQLGASYKAASRIKQKLMQAMVKSEFHRQLSSRVEIDDAYLGGERPPPLPTARDRVCLRLST